MNRAQLVSYVLPLNHAAATLDLVGGKGAALARMATAGLPVPPGFHVTTAAYRRFVAEHGLQEHILAAVAAAAPDLPATLQAASAQIKRLFEQNAIPDDVAVAIRQAYADLGGSSDLGVAVRSSATAEDLPELSFAGQQETYLNIHGAAAVLAAVQRCWASLWTACAIGYRIKNGIDQASVALAVVVQELVPAEAAGVMFTANPLDGRRDEVIINAAWGLGEAIVSGEVTPDTITAEKATGKPLRRATAAKQVMTIRAETGTAVQPVPAAHKNAPVLSDEQIAMLTRYGVQIETLYDAPMDIEWALAGGEFAILQARPITALPEAQAEPPAEWQQPDPKALYIRASIIEQLPEPLTPLFATLAGPIIDEATRRVLGWMVGGTGLKRDIRLFATINDHGYMNVKFGLANTVRVGAGQSLKMRSIFKQSEPRWRQAHNHYAEVIRSWLARPLAGYSATGLLDGVRALFGETMQVYTVLQTGPIATALGSETMFTQLYNRLLKRKDDPNAAIFLMGFVSMPIRADLALYDLVEWARTRPRLDFGAKPT